MQHEREFYHIGYSYDGTHDHWKNSHNSSGKRVRGSAEKVKARQKSIPAQIISLDENVYVVWGSNDTANNNAEVFFRTSSDGGQTYTDKVNLSNSSGANSTDFDVEATDDNVIVSWWETNQTSAEPVIIVSTDNGATFGPILKLATNGTIGAAR